MNIDEAKRFVDFIINQGQASSKITPEQFNDAAKRAQLEWVKQRLNNPEDYQPGTAEPRIAYQQTQKLTDDLSFLLKRTNLTVDNNGEAKYPADYMRTGAFRYKHSKKVGDEIIRKEVEIDQPNEAELGSVLASEVVQPTKRYPKMVFYDKFMQFYPVDLKIVILVYFRLPVDPEWKFTIVNGRPVYDEPNSTDFEVREDEINSIIMRILRYVGIHVREPQVQQYAEQMKQTGV